MLALSIRQPYAELILRGIKTTEYRTQPTRIIGERFHIYASKRKLPVVGGRWSVTASDNVVVPTAKLPGWMIELAEQVGMIEPGALLPTGVIVGSAVIERCEPVERGALYRWHLADVKRLATPRAPSRHPQPAWFRPY